MSENSNSLFWEILEGIFMINELNFCVGDAIWRKTYSTKHREWDQQQKRELPRADYSSWTTEHRTRDLRWFPTLIVEIEW